MPNTVLVVEDEENLLAALTYNLEREGYTVLTAGDGQAALALARRHSPDLIILDVMLPELDGLEVCRILRRESEVPILMLTAKGEEADRIRGLDSGADDYIAKPFSVAGLLARVRAVLRRAHDAADGDVITHGELEMDLAAKRVRRGGVATGHGQSGVKATLRRGERSHAILPGRLPGRTFRYVAHRSAGRRETDRFRQQRGHHDCSNHG